ncbi:MAG: hypothetical protein ICV73_28520 [Acetobacteraceae bacterium]|nr:hypothetical protein [Acetobacteraceae bacterium]
MSDNRSSVRCPACGMINWATADGCKRCGEWFGVEDYPAPGAPPQHGRQQYAQQQYGQQFGQPYPPPYGPPRGAPPSAGRRALRAVAGTLAFLAIAGTLGTMGITNMLAPSDPEWRYYKSTGGNYSVRMPAEPEVRTKDFKFDPSMTYKEARAALSGNEGCSVIHADYPVSIGHVTTEQIEKVARQMASATESEVVAIRPLRLGSHKGVEMEVRPPAKLMRNGRAYWRIYVAGSRLYTMLLVGRDGGKLLEEKDEFFDSFSVPAAPDESAGAE